MMLEKVLEVPVLQPVVAVVVTSANGYGSNFMSFSRLVVPPLIAFLALNVSAAVLPEDRADVLYHSYDGGGVMGRLWYDVGWWKC